MFFYILITFRIIGMANSTTSRHFSKASHKATVTFAVIALWIMCATQGICSYVSNLTAAIILRAISVSTVVDSVVLYLSLLCNFKKRAHGSNKCLPSFFILISKPNEWSCRWIGFAVTLRSPWWSPVSEIHVRAHFSAFLDFSLPSNSWLKWFDGTSGGSWGQLW